MSLLELPAEILVQIFDYVGSSYFRSDLSRLTVSKQWSKFAYAACFGEFQFTRETLRRLLSCPEAGPSLPLIIDTIQTLDLRLQGSVDLYSAPFYGRPPFLVEWDELNVHLDYLANIMKTARRLRNLRIRATAGRYPHGGRGPRSSVPFIPIRTFLSPSNLRSVELDLVGIELNPPQHICENIAVLLTTLRSLRLRIPDICPHVLKLERQISKLPLNSLIINLTVLYLSCCTIAADYARCCFCPEMPFRRLERDIQEQAKGVAAQMAGPKIVRIVAGEGRPNHVMKSFDALTGKHYLIEGADRNSNSEIMELVEHQYNLY